MKKESSFNARSIAFMGMLGALAGVLMLFDFPLPIAPSFLEMDIAELPCLFAGFFMGPLQGFLVIVVKILVKFVIKGTKTAFVGEFSNLVGSALFVCTAAFIYKKKHTKKGAMISMVVSTLVVSAAYVFMNAFIMFPLYSRLYGLPMEAIIGMGNAVNPLVTDELTMMLFCVFPFNLIKYTAVSLITYLVYKKCANAIRSILNVSQETAGSAA
ncbi:MAG: ECF transporter S component [bacterium]